MPNSRRASKSRPLWATTLPPGLSHFQEGTVKHIYFVAETKGSISSMGLRDIEKKGKIARAKKLFE